MRHRTTVLAPVLLALASLVIVPLLLVASIYEGRACLLLNLLFTVPTIILLILKRLTPAAKFDSKPVRHPQTLP
jgi:hypothetical protein